MKQPSDLTREELEDIVSQVRNVLWKDYATDELDPGRSWNSETIEWVSGVLEDAGLKPDRVVPDRPVIEEVPAPGADPSKDPRADAMVAALEAFVRTIEATGGCIRPGHASVERSGDAPLDFAETRPVPAGDEEWADLADAYILVCQALGREPMVRDEDDPDEDDSET
jgi:hypothetical protein